MPNFYFIGVKLKNVYSINDWKLPIHIQNHYSQIHITKALLTKTLASLDQKRGQNYGLLPMAHNQIIEIENISD